MGHMEKLVRIMQATSFHKQLKNSWEGKLELDNVDKVLSLTSAILDNLYTPLISMNRLDELARKLGEGIDVDWDNFSIEELSMVMEGIYLPSRNIVDIDIDWFISEINKQAKVGVPDIRVYEEFIKFLEIPNKLNKVINELKGVERDDVNGYLVDYISKGNIRKEDIVKDVRLLQLMVNEIYIKTPLHLRCGNKSATVVKYLTSTVGSSSKGKVDIGHNSADIEMTGEEV